MTALTHCARRLSHTNGSNGTNSRSVLCVVGACRCTIASVRACVRFLHRCCVLCVVRVWVRAGACRCMLASARDFPSPRWCGSAENPAPVPWMHRLNDVHATASDVQAPPQWNTYIAHTSPPPPPTNTPQHARLHLHLHRSAFVAVTRLGDFHVVVVVFVVVVVVVVRASSFVRCCVGVLLSRRESQHKLVFVSVPHTLTAPPRHTLHTPHPTA